MDKIGTFVELKLKIVKQISINRFFKSIDILTRWPVGDKTSETNVTLDHKTSPFLEIEIYASSES